MNLTEDKYLQTKNAKLLEDILRARLPHSELALIDAAKILNNDNASRESIYLAINLCRNVITDYIELTGALCKGELSVIGSKVFDSSRWRFNRYIMNRPITRVGKLTLRETLLEDGLHYEKLAILISKLNEPRTIIYEHVTSSNNTIWFKELNKALVYVNDSITKPYIPELVSEKVDKLTTKNPLYISRAKYLSDLAIAEAEIVNVSKETEFNNSVIKMPVVTFRNSIEQALSSKSIVNKDIIKMDQNSSISMTQKEFLIKYDLDDRFYDGKQSAISGLEDIKMTLFEERLSDNDIRAVNSMILRNPEFANNLKISKTNNYSKDKIIQFGRFYADARQYEREELIANIANVFGR